MKERSPGLRILLASSCQTPLTDDVLTKLSGLPRVEIQVIHDEPNPSLSTLYDAGPQDARALYRVPGPANYEEKEVAHLCGWADLLILAPISADNLARMLHGITDSLLLEVIRSWDVSKKVLLVPGMSNAMWENPTTKKQLRKLRRKWAWVRVLAPLLWNFESEEKQIERWGGMKDLLEAIQHQLDLATIGHGVESLSVAHPSNFEPSSHGSSRVLPPELWSIILEYTCDWELAQALDVFTNIPTPIEWLHHTLDPEPTGFAPKLEWALLKGTLKDTRNVFDTHPPATYLSQLAIKLIMRFSMTPILTYLETAHHDLFLTTFGHGFIPDKASRVFGNTALLTYWHTSPSFLSKQYSSEALDGASKAGFVHVLDWWRNSGLPLKYTEAALESASSAGHTAVLSWWKNASLAADQEREKSDLPKCPPIPLKPGKSIVHATQFGSLPVLRWWFDSGVPFSHENSIAKLASVNGYVHILDFYRGARGDKMVFDNQVLVHATKTGHANVLEWWRRSGLRVEYKICDIEEALEDGVGGEAGKGVRRWWARNGLNLGVGTSEWMQTKVLG
ncbi:flavo protein [Aulographum hederae CBS 113979]|uniref:Flavo protein n=1 Tax=Aulographum hederae CBS 113979 TaxID=1176131 RepID=A0A6G1GMC7_9PEZI|nr:flavo protein [Aulographum hederae CBS 113979]